MIESYLDNLKLNPSKSQFWSRAIDQKIKYDVISLVADSVLNMDDEWFTTRDVYESSFFLDELDKRFGKAKDITNEVNKFVGQPLLFLNIFGLLEIVEGRPHKFSVKEKFLLELISKSDQSSLKFLIKANLKLLDVLPIKSEILHYVRSPSKPSRTDKDDLIRSFEDFIFSNTNIKNKNEPRRKLWPFLKIIAYHFKGWSQISSNPSLIYIDDIGYNKRNFRDKHKPKNISRARAAAERFIKQEPEFYESRLARVKDEIKENEYSSVYSNIDNVFKTTKYGDEVKKILDNMNKREQKGIHVHHIFPRNEFPELSLIKENLIYLNANEHLLFSHPYGNTQVIDRNYQKVLLLLQLSEIEKDLDNHIRQYDLREFIEVLNVGLSTDIFSEYDSVQTIRDKLEDHLFSKTIIN